MIGVLFALLSAVSFGLQQYYIKKGIIRTDKYKFLIIGNILAVMFLLLICAFTTKLTLPSNNALAYILLIGLIGAIAQICFYKGLEVGKLSLVSGIANSYPLVGSIFAIFFYNESLTIMQIVGMICVFVGLFLVMFRFEDFKNIKITKEKGVYFALITLVLWGFYTALQTVVINEIGPILSTFYIEGVIGALSIVFFFKKFTDSKRRAVDSGSMKFIILCASLVTLGCLLFSFALKFEKTSISTALGGLTPFIVLILSMMFLKEKLSLKQKIGIVLNIIGVIILSF